MKETSAPGRVRGGCTTGLHSCHLARAHSRSFHHGNSRIHKNKILVERCLQVSIKLWPHVSNMQGFDEIYCISPCVMCTHCFVCIIHGVIVPIIMPMYSMNSYFSLKSLVKKVYVIHGKIW